MLKNVKCARCVKCGKEYEAVPNLTNCECGGILDIIYDYDYIKANLTKEKLKSRPNTMCMTHMSHFYPQGANLYFIFQAKMDSIDEYLEYQYGIMDHIQKAGASMSHHHGIGKMTAPWLEAQIGHNEMEVYRALKEHFDPDHIMNPGGTLGLDLPEEQKRDLIHKK